MIETLLGGLLGGAFRLAPEILKWLDRKGERGHELAMQDKVLEFEKLRGAQRMSEIGAGAEAAWNVGAIETLREAVRSRHRGFHLQPWRGAAANIGAPAANQPATLDRCGAGAAPMGLWRRESAAGPGYAAGGRGGSSTRLTNR